MIEPSSILSRRGFISAVLGAAAFLPGCESVSQLTKSSVTPDASAQPVHATTDILAVAMADHAFRSHEALAKDDRYFPIHRGAISQSYLLECFENLFKGREGKDLRTILTDDSRHHPIIIAQTLAARVRNLKPEWVSSLYSRLHFEEMIDKTINKIEPHLWPENRDFIKENILGNKGLGKLQHLELEILFYMSFGLNVNIPLDLRCGYVKTLVEKNMAPVDPKNFASNNRSLELQPY